MQNLSKYTFYCVAAYHWSTICPYLIVMTLHQFLLKIHLLAKVSVSMAAGQLRPLRHHIYRGAVVGVRGAAVGARGAVVGARGAAVGNIGIPTYVISRGAVVRQPI